MNSLRPPRRLALLPVLALVASLAACSGGDDDLSEPGTAAPSSADTTAPPTMSPRTTSPPTTVPPPPTAERSVVTPALDGQPDVGADVLLDATNGRGVLLVGWSRPALGERASVAMWESADGLAWTAVDSPAFHVGTYAWAQAATWHGSTLALGGAWTDEAGERRPGVWLAADGLNVAPPENPFGGPGTVTVLAPADSGLVAAGNTFGRPEGEPAVAVRDAAGTWTRSQLPPGSEDTTIMGVAASGARVVVTGWTLLDNGVGEAVAWVSNDGGATFASAVASAFSGASAQSSGIGDVASITGGFLAVACAPGERRPVTALALSQDGVVWQRIDIDAAYANGDRYPNVTAVCTDLTIVQDRALVGTFDTSASLLALDFAGNGLATNVPRSPNQIAVQAPLTAWTGARVALVSRQSRGFTSALADDEGHEGTASGLPTGAPELRRIDLQPGQGRLLTTIDRYPIVTEYGDDVHTWGTRLVWAASVDGRSWEDAAGQLPSSDATGLLVSDGIELAWGPIVDDPADTRQGGPLGGTQLWTRSQGQPWEALGIIAGGPGGERVSEILALPTGFLAIGDAGLRDASTGVASNRPLALASGDGRTWGAEEVPAPSDQTRLNGACVLPGGAVLAHGSANLAGRSVLFTARRAPDGSWAMVDAATQAPGIEAFTTCASDRDGVTLVAQVDDRPVVVRTTDGTTFTTTALDGDEFVPAHFAAIGRAAETFVAAGTISVGGESDAAVWTSTDGQTWARLDTEGLGGSGEQVANDVEVIGDELLVSGLDRGAPVVWRLPLPG